jgi:DNA-binding transcriptional ArsR family regulator
MLRRLAGGARTIGELAEPFDMSFAAAAKHVKVLEQAGLLSCTIEGRSHRCRLAAGPLAAADRWLAYYERFWSMRLDDLERVLTRDSNKRSRK